MKTFSLALIRLFAVMLVFHQSVTAQDMHFSHFFASPMQQNPAQAGAFDGDWRVGLNYRNQWQSVTVPWRTFDLYGDVNLLQRETKPYYVGAGLLIMRDQAGDGNLGVTKFLASGAVHYKLKNTEQHEISGGLQLGYVRKSIDWNKLYFDNQWNDATFDQGLPSFEQYKGSSLGYVDAAFGLHYRNYSNEQYNYYGTFAAHHLIQPRETFYENGKNKLGMRPVIGAGAGVKVSPEISVNPAFHYMRQKKASELMVGGMVGYDMTGLSFRKMVAYAGVYNRMKDAFYPVIGMDYGAWRGFISYDINTSDLKPASGGRGGIELSLMYIGGIIPPTPIYIPCPRF